MMRRYLYLILATLLIIIIVLAIPRKRDFRIDGEEILAQMKLRTQIISIHKYKTLKAEKPGTRLVDLRGAEAFNQAHLGEAVNLPVNGLAMGEIYGFFQKKEAPYVLYAEDTYQAEMYWILFSQMGIERLYVLDTGEGLDSLILNWENEDGRMILVDEVPQFSFQPDTSLKF